MSNPTQGDRVFHPNQKGWGLGKVLSVTPDNIDVFFVGTGAKQQGGQENGEQRETHVFLEIAKRVAVKKDSRGDA